VLILRGNAEIFLVCWGFAGVRRRHQGSNCVRSGSDIRNLTQVSHESQAIVQNFTGLKANEIFDESDDKVQG
jgi:hypothetical protein